MSRKTKTPHLWEVEHAYYCHEGNYYATDNPPMRHFDSFAAYLDEEGSLDPDLNLLFRWDWRRLHG